MTQNPHYAADVVRTRLRTLEGPITQEQMQVLIDDLKTVMGGVLSRRDVIEIVEAFQDEATQPGVRPR